MSVLLNTNGQSVRECINDRTTYTVKSSACLICRVIELTACMKCSKHQSLGAHSFLMHLNRNTSSVILNRCRSIGFKGYMNLAAVACKMFIDGIVHYLVYKMIKSLGRYGSDIHSGTYSYGLQSLKDCNIGRIICITVRFIDICCHIHS